MRETLLGRSVGEGKERKGSLSKLERIFSKFEVQSRKSTQGFLLNVIGYFNLGRVISLALLYHF